MRGPLDRLDLFAAVGVTAPFATHYSQGTSNGSIVRFFDQPVLSFPWDGIMAFLTTSDVIAFVGATILLVRFIAWALSPLFRRNCE